MTEGIKATEEPSTPGAICRYCLEPEDEAGVTEFVSPCECRGDQEFVHWSCLRKWQRTVLIGQSTHPSEYDDADRHLKCSVCVTLFTLKPPTRYELMEELVGLPVSHRVNTGNLIVATKRFSLQLTLDVVKHPFPGELVRCYAHWMYGVYYITRGTLVAEGFEPEAVPVLFEGRPVRVSTENKCTLRDAPVQEVDVTLQLEKEVADYLIGVELKKQAHLADLTPVLRIEGRSYFVVDFLEMEKPSAAAMLEALSQLDEAEHPKIVLTLRRIQSQGEDSIIGINLTRPYEEGDIPEIIQNISSDLENLHTTIRLQHFLGGPCDIGQSIIMIYNRDFTLQCEKALKEGKELVYEPLDIPENSYYTVDYHWVVFGDLDQAICWAAHDAPPPADGDQHLLCCYWGHAIWSRTQLLGEIARGSWGMAQDLGDSYVEDVSFSSKTQFLQSRRKVYNQLQQKGRLIVAKHNEMSDYSDDATLSAALDDDDFSDLVSQEEESLNIEPSLD